ncbi:MAG: hypothetical protein JHC26_10550 [Thermofilum sp.]|jgi:hypothetical protein|uniref:hypothetical protein n=1 Tax=Thermofilum sp. TaxID=1961369 RepID=UPI00258BF948|nr:hypothetical protein [Thermofilum sp.]MCI4409520.1 hypothetical protein [Thermofilum sp.]
MSLKQEFTEKARQSVKLYTDYTLRNYQHVKSLADQAWHIAEIQEQRLRRAYTDYANAMFEALAIDMSYLFRAYHATSLAELAEIAIQASLDQALDQASQDMADAVKTILDVINLTDEPKWSYVYSEIVRTFSTYAHLLKRADSDSYLAGKKFTANMDFDTELARAFRALMAETKFRLALMKFFTKRHEAPIYKAPVTLLKALSHLSLLALALSLAYPPDPKTQLRLLKIATPATYRAQLRLVANMGSPWLPDALKIQAFVTSYREKIEAERQGIRQALIDILEAYPRALNGLPVDPQVWTRAQDIARHLFRTAYTVAQQTEEMAENQRASGPYKIIMLVAFGALDTLQQFSSRKQ